jgi:hypothetical protein
MFLLFYPLMKEWALCGQQLGSSGRGEVLFSGRVRNKSDGQIISMSRHIHGLLISAII